MGALAFVPGRYVRLAWQARKADMPQLLRVEKFIICYLETWLEGPNHCSREKPRLMNCKRIRIASIANAVFVMEVYV